MVLKVEDFKDGSGDWVYRYTADGGTRYFTRAGMFYHALKQRVNPKGAKQQASPMYAGCTSEFLDFQDFADWCRWQWGYFEDGFQLDKDLLSKGNKVYSRDTIVFIPQEINKLLTKRDNCRGKYPIGVTAEKGGNSYRAGFTRGGIRANLGNFKTVEEAFQAYKTAKEDFIKQQANKWRTKIDPRAYDALMNYQVEITD